MKTTTEVLLVAIISCLVTICIVSSVCDNQNPQFKTTVDTLTVYDVDTVFQIDTFTIIKPKIIKKVSIVRDTSKEDSLRAVINLYRSYEAQYTFMDSAWVKHEWATDEDYIVRINKWNYRPAPQVTIFQKDTTVLEPPLMKKIIYGTGLLLSGFAIGHLAK